MGLIEGGSRVIVGQVVAVLATWVFAAVMLFILLKIVDVTIGLLAGQQDEMHGLDLGEHGEEGYIF